MSQSTIMSVFSHIETAPPLPGYFQYFRGVKCLLKDNVGTKSWQLPRYHFNYHGELETTTQDKRGPNLVRVNAWICFYVETFS